MTPAKTMGIGTFLSALLLYAPICWHDFSHPANLFSRAVQTILISTHHAARLFTFDGDFKAITQGILSESTSLQLLYTTLGALLFVMAPMLTFGFVLSLFKNFAAYRKLLSHPRAPLYVFSELNERSLALAKSVISNHKKAILVFASVDEKNATTALAEDAKELGAICLKNDMPALNLKFHTSDSGIYFFAISEDDAKNISHAISVVTNPLYRYRKSTRLYVFSVSSEGTLITSGLQNKLSMEIEKSKSEGSRRPEIFLKRVNSVRSLIYRTLYDEGEKLFYSAVPSADGEKTVSALVLGTGSQGTEMIRALSWFGQMQTPSVKYRIDINAFDKDEKASERFSALCPELMSEDYNGVFVEGEAQYKIAIHGGMDVSTSLFTEKIKSLGSISYVFISLGSDELNIHTAVALRTLFEQLHQKPIIEAVVYDSKRKKELKDAKTAFGDDYGIDCVGDLDTLYSEDVIVHSALEEAAMEIHSRYGSPMHDFWAHEYNYSSSMASAIHNEVRIRLGVPGAGKKELTEKERDFIELLEHRRWNAYMRSEGWVYSQCKSPESRNNLGKMHHNLVCFKELSDIDKRKDSTVATKKASDS